VEAVSTVRAALVGCGAIAQHYVRSMVSAPGRTRVVAVAEPSLPAYEAIAAIFLEGGCEPPPNLIDLDELLGIHGAGLDVALVSTPHRYHAEQASACLEAGLDVLLEKPMAIDVREARALVRTREQTGRQLVIAFNASLSSRTQAARRLLRSGELGRLLTITATVWEGWLRSYRGHWKQDTAISGGGFVFDTGSHMLNLVLELAGEPISEVAAFLRTGSHDPDLDVAGTVIGRLDSGGLVTMTACGDTITTCDSEVRVFCSGGILRTGVWGEHLALQREGERDFTDVPPDVTVSRWERFLAVHEGLEPNPCPPEAGLRMALLWEAIKQAARYDGTPTIVGR
jgi:predicted dehydrogenase